MQDGLEISRRLNASGLVDFLNVVRGHIDTDPGLTDLIPIQGMRSAPHLDFAGEIRAATDFPTFHAARIPDIATARPPARPPCHRQRQARHGRHDPRPYGRSASGA